MKLARAFSPYYVPHNVASGRAKWEASEVSWCLRKGIVAHAARDAMACTGSFSLGDAVGPGLAAAVGPGLAAAVAVAFQAR